MGKRSKNKEQEALDLPEEDGGEVVDVAEKPVESNAAEAASFGIVNNTEAATAETAAVTEALAEPTEAPVKVTALEEGHDVEIKKTRRDITLKLTDFQVSAAAKRAADAAKEKADLEEELDSTKKRFKGQIDDLEERIKDDLKIVRAGAEQRTLDVTDRFDYTDGVVRTVWGGDIVETRAVTFEERQQGLAFIDKRDKVKADQDAKASEPATDAPVEEENRVGDDTLDEEEVSGAVHQEGENAAL